MLLLVRWADVQRSRLICSIRVVCLEILLREKRPVKGFRKVTLEVCFDVFKERMSQKKKDFHSTGADLYTVIRKLKFVQEKQAVLVSR